MEKYKAGLSKSRSGFLQKLEEVFKKKNINEAFYEELEEILIAGDVGIETTLKLISLLQLKAAEENVQCSEQLKDLLAGIIEKLVSKNIDYSLQAKPHIILMVGVNGSGKTTTAAKIAKLYLDQGKKVLLVAGDTFRSAAIDQIKFWSEKIGADLIKQLPGTDPSALYYDAMKSAQARDIDVVIGDTAGRLHNKENLMSELNKIYRVIGKNISGAPHEVLLVVDATTGHNALLQGEIFNKAAPLTGLVLTKLDGTARGGIVIGISDLLDIPVKYLGLGEKTDDLLPFEPKQFVEALLEK